MELWTDYLCFLSAVAIARDKDSPRFAMESLDRALYEYVTHVDLDVRFPAPATPQNETPPDHQGVQTKGTLVSKTGITVGLSSPSPPCKCKSRTETVNDIHTPPRTTH